MIGEQSASHYPEGAEKEDALLRDKRAHQRTQVTLKRDERYVEFERYSGLHDESNPMCPALDIVLTVRGRIDAKRNAPLNKNCRQPFGMCNYRARFVLESVQDVSVTGSKPKCK